MKKHIRKVLIAWLLIFSLFAPSGLAVQAENSTETGEITVLEGAISQHFNDITTYRQEGALQAPPTPTEYVDYIFAGWFTDAECNAALSEQLVGTKITDENKAAYAKFVPKNVLSVNAQIPSETDFTTETSNIRFVTTVDSLQYQEVGFDFVIKGIKLNSKTTKVYKRLYAMDDSGNKIKSYIPKHIDSESEYFMSCIVTGVTNKDFGTGLTATPYWITQDGTKVSGETATKSVNMGYMSSMAEVVTEEVGEFEQPTDVWSISHDPNYISAQGGCTDGTYYYQAVIHRDTADMSSEEFDTDKNESIIQKYSWSDKNACWELSSTSKNVFKMANANDITYNSKLGLLVITHCGEPNAGKNRVSFMNPETLKLVDPSSIDANWASGEYIDCGHAITAIDYNALRNQYVVNVSGTQQFKVLNADFSEVGIVSTPTSQTANYSKQALSSDDSYVYYLFHQNNAVAVYDWDGNFVTLIDTDIDEAIETENISVYNNKIYIGCDDPTNSKTVIYQVTDVQNFTSDSTVGADTFVLNDVAVTDFYAESTVVVSSANTDDATYPRAGLRMTNTNDTNVDFVLNYDSSGLLYALVATPNASGEGEQQQLYYIDSAINNASTIGIKLAVAKTGDTLAFYVNDVLQGTKTFDGFGADDTVITKLYSKYTTSSFSGYRIITTNIEETLNTLHDTFVADSSDTKVRFDLLNEEDETNPKVTINENEYNGSIVNWNSVSASKFYAETTINLTGSNLDGGTAWAGMVLTEGNNRFYVLLYGSSTEITRLYCYSMDASAPGGYDNKTEVLKQTISLTDDNITLGLDRDGNSLQILLGGTSYSIDLSDSLKVPHTIAGATTVGLTGWNAQATFTDYSFALTSDKDDSAKDILVLNEEASANIYAETTVKVGKVKSSAWPRVGLRLKNTSEENVDFILTYNNDGSTLLYAEVATTEVLQTYCVDSAISSVSTDGVKMAVAKEDGVLYFYLNDVLLGTKAIDSFTKGVEVTARLYSKYTTSYFSDYSVTTKNVEIPMYEPARTFVADENKSRIYFDILDEADATSPQVVTNESNKTWAANSIVNWNEVETTKFLAETKVELTGSHESGSGAGIVLTSGDNRFYVMLVGTADGVTGLQCYSTKLDEMSMNVETNPRKLEYSSTVSLTEANKLTVYRIGEDLVICINDEVQTAIDLSKIAYPITGASKVGLAGWRIKATFTEYNIETGSSCPTMNETVMLVANAPSEQVLESKTLEISDDNEAYVDVKMNGASDNHDYLYIGEAGTKVYAETYLDFTKESGDQRVGLVLKDKASDEYVAIYLYAKDTANVSELEIATRTTYQPTDNTTKYTFPIEEKDLSVAQRKNIKLAVLRDGENFVVYINDIVVCNKKWEDVTGCTMTAETETYVGLHVMQSTATFYDFKTATPNETMYLAATAHSERDVSSEVIISDENEITTNTSIRGTSGKHGYMYFGEASTEVYAETYVDFTSTSTSEEDEHRIGLSLVNEDNTAQFGMYLYVKGTGDVSHLQVFTNTSDDNATWTAKSTTLPDGLGRTGIKLALLRSGDQFVVCVNDEAVYTGAFSGYDGFGITAETNTYVGLNVMQQSATFYNYKIATVGETASLALNAVESKNAKLQFAGLNANGPQLNVYMENGRNYLYFNESGTKITAETTVDLKAYSSEDTTTDLRAGLALKDSNGNMLVFYLKATESTDITEVNIHNVQNDSSVNWSTGSKSLKFSNVGLANQSKNNAKLKIVRDENTITVYVNDNLIGSVSTTDFAAYPVTGATTVGLHVYQNSALFSNFTCTCE